MLKINRHVGPEIKNISNLLNLLRKTNLYN